MRWWIVCFVIIICWFNVYADDEEHLEFVLIVARHGDRAPLNSFPNLPFDELENFKYGWLTKYGQEQLFALGQRYRTLFSTDDVNSICADRLMFLRSTEIDRCVTSATRFGEGFCESTSNPSLSVNTAPLHTDALLKAQKMPFFKQMKEELFSSYTWKRMEAQNAVSLQDLSDIVGAEIRLQKLPRVDGSLKYYARHKPELLPPSVTPQLLQRVNRLADWVRTTRFARRSAPQFLNQTEADKDLFCDVHDLTAPFREPALAVSGVLARHIADELDRATVRVIAGAAGVAAASPTLLQSVAATEDHIAGVTVAGRSDSAVTRESQSSQDAANTAAKLADSTGTHGKASQSDVTAPHSDRAVTREVTQSAARSDSAVTQESQQGLSPHHRIHYYSAHDSTVLSLLTLMGVPNPRVPDYASHVCFELWRKDRNFNGILDAEDFRVQIKYDREPANVPGCEHDCSLPALSKELRGFTTYIGTQKDH
eukprot:TRINITY_DN7228_c0_g1_i18.p1 TRINITY_DN7228_c0_g1~~TRINITY_DN7228_c0_g1_i18.p1  ORF type:complete len:482 (-),score=103.66 TRINITY_DN7228_c0_g1_i18:267-1712(-)